MIRYQSNLGGETLDFERVVLNGRAPGGGLYVPTYFPQVSLNQLEEWKDLTYVELAHKILSLFIEPTVIPSDTLSALLEKSFRSFYHPSIIPNHPLTSEKDIYVQELFHGPTLSFKDVAMGFVVNLFDYFLQKKKEKMSVVVATSGDTGPAAAFACAAKDTLDAWVLYPKELITEEQERQMTTIPANNVFAVGVENCPDGSDDLDRVIDALFADDALRSELNLSSVNSINWARVMMQTVHYFYGYLQTVDRIGEPLIFSVPSGAFGNLCAGSIARKMGLPVEEFVIANNKNGFLSQLFTEGTMLAGNVAPSFASAIDISVPLNFWRFLYVVGMDTKTIRSYWEEFERDSNVTFDPKVVENYAKGFRPVTISDEQILSTIKKVYDSGNYVLDPHGAVAVAAATSITSATKILCLATAHPCKFPDAIEQALGSLPEAAKHPSIEAAKQMCQRIYFCDYKDIYTSLPHTMRAHSRLDSPSTF